jgi:hypothetical protein
MLMMRLAFPELDWEIGVRTRATLMLFDLQFNTRQVQKLNMSRRPVYNTVGRCFTREVEYFRIIQHARIVFLKCSVNDLAGKDNSQTEDSLLVTLQGDSPQKGNDSLRTSFVFELFSTRRKGLFRNFLLTVSQVIRRKTERMVLNKSSYFFTFIIIYHTNRITLYIYFLKTSCC